jgi:hypothetical protein
LLIRVGETIKCYVVTCPMATLLRLRIEGWAKSVKSPIELVEGGNLKRIPPLILIGNHSGTDYGRV